MPPGFPGFTLSNAYLLSFSQALNLNSAKNVPGLSKKCPFFSGERFWKECSGGVFFLECDKVLFKKGLWNLAHIVEGVLKCTIFCEGMGQINNKKFYQKVCV